MHLKVITKSSYNEFHKFLEENYLCKLKIPGLVTTERLTGDLEDHLSIRTQFSRDFEALVVAANKMNTQVWRRFR